MTATQPQPHPDLMIAIPGIRRLADQRWIVHIWRDEPCRATFRHYAAGRIDVEHQAEWAAGAWLAPIPVAIPPKLAARAHRELRRLARGHGQPLSTPADRLANIRARRRVMAAGQRPRLWGQA